MGSETFTEIVMLLTVKEECRNINQANCDVQSPAVVIKHCTVGVILHGE